MMTILRAAIFAISCASLAAAESSPAPAQGAPTHVEVYYFHASWRCVNCNNAEAYAKEATDTVAKEVEAEALRFIPVQLDKDPALVEAVKAVRVAVVVAEVREKEAEVDGKKIVAKEIVRFSNLGCMLPLINDKEKFLDRVKTAIQEFIPKEPATTQPKGAQ
jgi:hypothetical protein